MTQHIPHLGTNPYPWCLRVLDDTQTSSVHKLIYTYIVSPAPPPLAFILWMFDIWCILHMQPSLKEKKDCSQSFYFIILIKTSGLEKVMWVTMFLESKSVCTLDCSSVDAEATNLNNNVKYASSFWHIALQNCKPIHGSIYPWENGGMRHYCPVFAHAGPAWCHWSHCQLVNVAGIQDSVFHEAGPSEGLSRAVSQDDNSHLQPQSLKTIKTQEH